MRLDHDIGDNDGAGDRVAPRLDERHAYARMAVDRRLDLFGMPLEAADIDDAAAPTDEMITPVAQLNHVAGIDKTVLVAWEGAAAEIAERVAARLDPQR